MAKALKKFGRKTAKVHVIGTRILTPIASGAAGFLFGLPAAAAVDYGLSKSGGYFRGVQARAEGVRGLKARQLGHAEFKRDLMYGAAGGGAGVLASGLTTAFMGGSLGQSFSSGLFGQYGSSILGNQGSIFNMGSARDFGPSLADKIVTQGNLSAQQAHPLQNIVTSYGEVNPATSGSTSTVAGGAASPLQKTATDVLSKVLGNTFNPQQTEKNGYGSGGRGSQGGVFGGGGGGGDDGGGGFGLHAPRGGADGESGSMMPLLLIGGALLLMSAA